MSDQSPSPSTLNAGIRRIRESAPTLVWPREAIGLILRRAFGLDKSVAVSTAEPACFACAREFAAANQWEYVYPWSRDEQIELRNAVDQLERDLAIRSARVPEVLIDCFEKNDKPVGFVVHCCGELALESVPP